MIHMKCEVFIYSEKKKKNDSVICCKFAWHFKS